MVSHLVNKSAQEDRKKVMAKPLAVFTPYVGVLSETFIQKHIEQLIPGGVVVVAMQTDHVQHWQTKAPTLWLDQVSLPLGLRIISKLARLMRLPGLAISLQTLQQKTVQHFLVRHGVQVIMAEYLNSSVQWVSIANQLGIRFFAHAHGWDVSRVLRDPTWREKYLAYNEASGVITINQSSQERLVQLGLDPSKIHIIPCGVDVPSQIPSRQPNTTVKCLAVGRLVAKKSPIFLLDSFRRAIQINPNLHLDYVGAGDLFSAAQDFVKAMNLTEFVTLHGGQPQTMVHQLMQDADIFLQHSVVDVITGDEEGLPVAILEAMARELPVVSTQHAGIPEAVLEGETGFLVQEGDTQAMANCIVQLSGDFNLRTKMGKAGRQRIQDQFTLEHERRALLELMGLASVESNL